MLYLFCTGSRTRTDTHISALTSKASGSTIPPYPRILYRRWDSNPHVFWTLGLEPSTSTISSLRHLYYFVNQSKTLYRERDSNPHVLSDTGFLDQYGYITSPLQFLYLGRESNPQLTRLKLVVFSSFTTQTFCDSNRIRTYTINLEDLYANPLHHRAIIYFFPQKNPKLLNFGFCLYI